jgi:PASTA domain.
VGYPTTPSQPPSGRKLTTPAIVAIAVASAFVLVCGGCVAGAVFSNIGDRTTSTAADDAGTVSASVVGPAQTETVPVVSTASQEPSSPVDAPAPTLDEMIVVPNGVGLDYQSAQDLWRAAGLHVLPAKDALGANRLPIIDSNWVVLAQDPEAGAVVPRGSFITATVKKYTDQ